VVPDTITDSTSAIHIGDSREGWSEGLRQLLRGLYAGTLHPFDTSAVRPAGSVLKTFGGLASGPKPLHELHDFAATVFREAAGRRLTPLECHDLVCKIGESVVAGGVRRCVQPSLLSCPGPINTLLTWMGFLRSFICTHDHVYLYLQMLWTCRSALISLSDLSDADMRDAKTGAWWERNSSRYMANNSAVYMERPTRERFDEEWASLVASGSGERGLFSRAAAGKQAARFHNRRTEGIAFGTNPCSEIILRPQQFCNLSEVCSNYCCIHSRGSLQCFHHIAL
jgi:ribonucleoside-triphosphate reductase (thioredoxin)